MREMLKKITSVLLSVLLLFSVTIFSDCNIANMLTLNAFAANGNDIVSYARQFIGYPYVWGTQGPNSFDCSGFVRYVFKHFGISLPASSSNYWNNPTAYGTVIAYGSVDNARAGDVISWSGHVAIYTENGYCVEALNPSYGVTEKFKVNSHTNGLNYKVIRIYGLESTLFDCPPSTASLSINKTEMRIGEEFTFSASSDALCSYYFSVFDADSGEKIMESSMSYTYTTSFLRAGHYSAYMSAYNSYGAVDSEWIDFYVFGDKPSKAELTVNKDSISLGESVTLTTKTDAYYSKIYMSIFNSNGKSVFSGNVSDVYTFTPEYNDTYSCYVSAYTHEGGVDSNNVKFVVGDRIQNNGTTILYVSDVSVRSNDVIKVLFSMNDAENINSISIGNLKYNKSLLTLQKKEWKLSDSVISSTDGDYSVIKFNDNRDCNGIVFEATFLVSDVDSFVETEISCDVTARYELPDGNESSIDVKVENGVVKINGEKSLDYDKNGYVTTDDAVYVLKHIMMPDIFEVTGGVDFDKNGHETTDDAVYLLKHIMMPDIYPIN
ncbi:MAG: C40 family peptidase [Clostridia bacterium]|nr:C40 family peptidase [Clostridia bacterium]